MARPMHTYALLVIDMQEEFRTVCEKIVTQVNATIRHCREYGIPVIFTQHGYRQLLIDSGQQVEQWGSAIRYGSDEWQLLPELDVQMTDYVLSEKRRHDAFYGTLLGVILRKMQVNTVVISGVMTNLCCETTARSASVRDFRVFFLSDGTASNCENMHKASLLNISYGFGRVMTCQEFRQMFS